MRHLIAALIAITTFLVISALGISTAKSQPILCQDVTAIFARGSGRDVRTSKEWTRFQAQLDLRMKESKLRYLAYELGSQPQSGHQYPAVSIDDFSIKLGAWISAGTTHSYGKSVDEGNMELATYIAKIITACPDSKIVLAGYSQGAHVMGDAIQSMPRKIRNQVAFVALFGDPKLYLPEGEGFNPPACEDKDLSSWRRMIEDCHTDNGVLGARKPYIPQDMENKVGLWCLDDDFICGSSKNLWVSNGHQQYDQQNGPIDQAAQEITEKLKTTFTYQSHLGKINTAPRADQKPQVDVQILFVVDRTVNMQHDYPNYFLPKIRKLVESLPSNAAIGFDYYVGCWRNDNPAKYNWALTVPHLMRDFDTKDGWVERSTRKTTWMNSDVVGSLYQLPYFSIEPGCDLSWELGVHAWRAMADFVQLYPSLVPRGPETLWLNNKRQRIIIPITNTAYYPNDTPFGDNNGLLTQATTNPPQTAIIPLVPDSIRPTFDDLADLDDTSQLFLVDDDQIGETIIEQFGTNRQIEARLRSTDYQFPQGTTVTFDASPTIVHEDTIATYEWDFDNDGTPDTTTTQPSTSHTYSMDPFENTMTVKITTASGLTDTATASVRIINLADLPPVPKAPQNLKLELTSQTSVQFSWQASDDVADMWMLYLNDVPLGYTEKTQTSIEITDIRPDEATTFGVRAISDQYETSEMATITLRPHASIFSQNHTSSGSAGTNSLSPATNVFEAFAKVFQANNILPIANDGQSGFRKPSLALIYYIIGGIVAAGLAFLVGLHIYKRRHTRNGDHSTEDEQRHGEFTG